ncbi:MAG: transporter substrate-binding domain-containing protein [Desulfovibrio sp.]|jgi:polar amino acid transport system substrate-binding protein|nr:transporter substrate-binding domain-containing protein [Desulfovibrio sp.]
MIPRSGILPAPPTMLLALLLLPVLLLPEAPRARAAEIVISGGSPATDADAPLRVFILDQPPWSCGCGGTPSGGAVEVTRAAMRRLGRIVEFQVLPFNRGIELVAQGRLDAVLGLYRTPERERRFHYTNVPLYDDEVVMLVRPVSGDVPARADPDSGIIRDAALYGGKPLATVLGYSYGPTLDTLFAQKGLIRLSPVYSLEEGVRALLDGRVGGVPGDRQTLRALMRRLPPGHGLELAGPPFDYVSAYMAFAPTEHNRTLARDFDRELGRMRASGEYAAIMADAFRTHDAHPK